MKKTLFLHIGLPKTGTTYLQCQIQANRDKLKKHGIFVPQTGQLVGRDHNLLALALQPERWDQFPVDISAVMPNLWSNLLQEINNCDCSNIIITSEAFSWEIKTSNQIKIVKSYFVDFDVKIIISERESYSFISSMYGHLLKTGRGPYSIDSFLIEFPYFWDVKYQKERWGHYFGIDNIKILSYDELNGEFIMNKFLEKLFPKHEILSEKFISSPDLNPNHSFSPRFLKFLEELSSNKIDTSQYIKLYSKVFSTLTPLDRSILSKREIDEGLERCGMNLYFSSSKEYNNFKSLKEVDQNIFPNVQISKEVIRQTQEEITRYCIITKNTVNLQPISDTFSNGTTTLIKIFNFKIYFSEFISKIKFNLIRIAKFIYKKLNIKYIESERFKSLEFLIKQTEERSRTIEYLLHSVTEHIKKAEFIEKIVEERSRTNEFLSRQNLILAQHQIEQFHNFYIESLAPSFSLNQRVGLNSHGMIKLETNYPIAVNSYDHLNPESTTEGAIRPIFFVQDCIRILGKNIKCLDIGTGAAGLVFEYVMNQVLAVGVDGSDFCRNNRVGYWPLLPHNLFTCDITKPFHFLNQNNQEIINFDLITIWEVLEHISEDDLPSLFNNICNHLSSGYVIGSISLLKYEDRFGNPYHLTIKPKNWWKAKFLESGLVMLDVHPFNEKLFCRGNGPRFEDFHNYSTNPESGFWFVAKKLSVNVNIV